MPSALSPSPSSIAIVLTTGANPAFCNMSEAQGPSSNKTGICFNANATVSDPTNWGYSGAQRAHGMVGFGPDADLPGAGCIQIPKTINQRTCIISTVAGNGSLSPLMNISDASGEAADGSKQSLEIGRQFVDQTLVYGAINVINVITDTAGFGFLGLEVEGYGYVMKYSPNIGAGAMSCVFGAQFNNVSWQCTARSGGGTALLFKAGDSTDNGGGQISFYSGISHRDAIPSYSYVQPSVLFGFNESGTLKPYLEICEPVVGQKVVALCKGGAMSATQMPANTGDRVVYLANCAAAPTTGSPVGGAILYVESGAVKAVGSSGTHTTMAAAEPHCPDCGRDFALEWKNPGKKEHLAVCVPCLLGSVKAAGVQVKGIIHASDGLV